MSVRQAFLSLKASSKATKVVAFALVLAASMSAFAACSARGEDTGSSASEINDNLYGRDRMPMRTYMK
jgi:hypothetical protein